MKEILIEGISGKEEHSISNSRSTGGFAWKIFKLQTFFLNWLIPFKNFSFLFRTPKSKIFNQILPSVLWKHNRKFNFFTFLQKFVFVLSWSCALWNQRNILQWLDLHHCQTVEMTFNIYWVTFFCTNLLQETLVSKDAPFFLSVTHN